MLMKPTVYQMDTAALDAFVTRAWGQDLRHCPRLRSDLYLDDSVHWKRFLIRSDTCCARCAPRKDPPLSLASSPLLDQVLSDEAALPSSMYLWAQMHHDDECSWMRTQPVQQTFWQSWAILTHRTAHLTMDPDGRGLCGFLRPTELVTFCED